MKKRHILYLLLVLITLGSCREQIDEEARFTFKGHTIASFLEEHENVYSSFIEILNRGDRLSLMKAYGQYTCFAPTNEAITRFLIEQDSIYWTSLKAHESDQTKQIIWTGVTSPELSELSDSMCKVISQTHIIPHAYKTLDLVGDIIPIKNMNDRFLSLSYKMDANNYSILCINGNGKVIVKDEEVENGVIHTVDAVLNPSANMLPTQIERHEYFHIMSEAIKATGYDDMMQEYIDETYTEGDLFAVSGNGKGQSPYPPKRYLGFTAFLEPDSIFFDAGIYNFNDLAKHCEKWYPEADPQAPLTSTENPVNQFVSYHLLDRNLPYSRLVCYGLSTSRWNSEDDYFDTSDRNEFYETMAKRTLKLTMPRSMVSNSTVRYTIYLNWYHRENDIVPDDIQKFMNVKIYSPNEFRKLNKQYADFDGNALNGTIHAIDKIFVYNEGTMAGRVLNMIVRIDFAGLCSEMMNNDIRWNGLENTYDKELFIPHRYCKNLQVYTEETRLFILAPASAWGSYQGDEMMGFSSYDMAYKLPRMPKGTYEIRFGYPVSPRRGIVQFYIDNEVAGIPVDMRYGSDDPRIGFIADAETEDNGMQNDKEMKNRGYLKGPGSMCGNTRTQNARDHVDIIRKVVITKYLTDTDHWFRFKNVFENDDGTAQFSHDYVEIVPISYVRDESIPIEEKRL